MAKSKAKGGVQVPKMGAGETVWTEVAKVAIKRGVNGHGEGPLMLTMHVASGAIPGGREFSVALNLGSGALVVTLDADKGIKSRVYIVDPQEMVESILAAEEE